jgi:hypothetical protein
LAGAVHQLLASDEALGGLDARHAPVLDPHAGDAHILDDARAMQARAFGERLGDVGGIGLAVGRQVGGTHQIAGVHQRPEIARLLRGQQVHLQAEGMGRRRLALDLGPALLVVGQSQAPVLLPTGGQTGFALERLIELHRVLQELRDRGA